MVLLEWATTSQLGITWTSVTIGIAVAEYVRDEKNWKWKHLLKFGWISFAILIGFLLALWLIDEIIVSNL